MWVSGLCAECECRDFVLNVSVATLCWMWVSRRSREAAAAFLLLVSWDETVNLKIFAELYIPHALGVTYLRMILYAEYAWQKAYFVLCTPWIISGLLTLGNVYFRLDPKQGWILSHCLSWRSIYCVASQARNFTLWAQGKYCWLSNTSGPTMAAFACNTIFRPVWHVPMYCKSAVIGCDAGFVNWRIRYRSYCRSVPRFKARYHLCRTR